MRCFTSTLICCSARSSCVIASTVDLMDSTPRRMGGRTKFSPAWIRTSSIFQDAKPGAVILTKYLPGATARKENAPVSSERVVRKFLVSPSSRVIWALEMVASSMSVTVPESTEALGASGNWMAEVAACCWARRSISQGTIRRRRTQRSLGWKGGVHRGLAQPISTAACPESRMPARMREGVGKGMEIICSHRI